jgi:hypothetical protein
MNSRRLTVSPSRKGIVAGQSSRLEGVEFSRSHREVNVRFGWWSQAVDATLYLRRKRWSGRRWIEDMFESSTRGQGSGCGTAGGAHPQLNRVAWQLNERSRETLRFETRAKRDLMLVLHRPIEPTAHKRTFRTAVRVVVIRSPRRRWQGRPVELSGQAPLLSLG